MKLALALLVLAAAVVAAVRRRPRPVSDARLADIGWFAGEAARSHEASLVSLTGGRMSA